MKTENPQTQKQHGYSGNRPKVTRVLVKREIPQVLIVLSFYFDPNYGLPTEDWDFQLKKHEIGEFCQPSDELDRETTDCSMSKNFLVSPLNLSDFINYHDTIIKVRWFLPGGCDGTPVHVDHDVELNPTY